jgi:hypothetical protein
LGRYYAKPPNFSVAFSEFRKSHAARFQTAGNSSCSITKLRLTNGSAGILGESTMRKLFVLLNLIGLILTVNQFPANANAALDIPVEVTGVKDLGLSDSDELKSLIEVSWNIDSIKKERIKSFNLLLSVRYADGTSISERRTVEKTALSARVEVPSVKTLGNRPAAFIKKIDARVTAVISKNQE